MDAATFRADFPEFSDTAAFPGAAVNFYLGLAGNLLNPGAWGDLLPYGTELFVAHNLSVNAARATAGSAAGGLVTSKSVDKLSVGYDVSVTTLKDGGYWNASSYGIQYWQLASMMGAGGIQLGAGYAVGDLGGQYGLLGYL